MRVALLIAGLSSLSGVVQSVPAGNNHGKPANNHNQDHRGHGHGHDHKHKPNGYDWARHSLAPPR